MGVIYSNLRATFKCCFPTSSGNKKKRHEHGSPLEGEAIELNLNVEDDQLKMVYDQILVPTKKIEIHLNGTNVGIVGGTTAGGGSVRNIAFAGSDAGGGGGGGSVGDGFDDENNDIPPPVVYEIIVETVKYDGIERTIEILNKPVEMDAELMETYEQSLRELCIVGPIPGGCCQRKYNSIGECYRYVFRIAERIRFAEKTDIVECHWLTQDQLFPPIYINKIVVKFTNTEHRNNFMIQFHLYNECIRNREIGCDRMGNLPVQCIYHLSPANNNLLSCIRRLKRFNAINNYEVINCEIFIRYIGEHYYEKIVKVPIISDIH